MAQNLRFCTDFFTLCIFFCLFGAFFSPFLHPITPFSDIYIIYYITLHKSQPTLFQHKLTFSLHYFSPKRFHASQKLLNFAE